jgi:hypothetical protein
MDNLKKRIQENIHKMNVDEPDAATWDRLKQGLSKHEEIDPLKDHISVNKNKLEIETPHAQTWEEIRGGMAAKEQVPVLRIKRLLIYLSAACIITITSLGVFRYISVVPVRPGNEVGKKSPIKNNVSANDTMDKRYDKNQITAIPSEPAESIKVIKHKSTAVASSKSITKEKKQSLPPEVLQIQKDYDQLIAGQIAYTKSLAVYGESASYFQEFMNDFEILENREKELRKSIARDGLHDNSIDELTTIYQQKLTVLKKLQNEITKTSNRNKNLTDTIPAYISL